MTIPDALIAPAFAEIMADADITPAIARLVYHPKGDERASAGYDRAPGPRDAERQPAARDAYEAGGRDVNNHLRAQALAATAAYAPLAPETFKLLAHAHC